jgi:hypothetical protein
MLDEGSHETEGFFASQLILDVVKLIIEGLAQESKSS